MYNGIINDLVESVGDKTFTNKLSINKDNDIWLSLFPSFFNGGILQSSEFTDGIKIRSGSLPDNLYKNFDGYQFSKQFRVEHSLTCKKGVLIIKRHNDLRYELFNIIKVFTPENLIELEPFIHHKRVYESQNTIEINFLHEKGYMKVSNLWQNSVDCIIDVRITHIESKSYINRDHNVILKSHEDDKMKKIL